MTNFWTPVSQPTAVIRGSPSDRTVRFHPQKYFLQLIPDMQMHFKITRLKYLTIILYRNQRSVCYTNALKNKCQYFTQDQGEWHWDERSAMISYMVIWSYGIVGQTGGPIDLLTATATVQTLLIAASDSVEKHQYLCSNANDWVSEQSQNVHTNI